MKKIADLKGNFSGSPARENSLKLLKYFRGYYKNDINLVGCGGIFTPKDAANTLNAGADLIQLITGMVFAGPSLTGRINRDLTYNQRYSK